MKKIKLIMYVIVSIMIFTTCKSDTSSITITSKEVIKENKAKLRIYGKNTYYIEIGNIEEEENKCLREDAFGKELQKIIENNPNCNITIEGYNVGMGWTAGYFVILTPKSDTIKKK